MYIYMYIYRSDMIARVPVFPSTRIIYRYIHVYIYGYVYAYMHIYITIYVYIYPVFPSTRTDRILCVDGARAFALVWAPNRE